MLKMTYLVCRLSLTANQTSVTRNVVSFKHRLSRVRNMALSSLRFNVENRN